MPLPTVKTLFLFKVVLFYFIQGNSIAQEFFGRYEFLREYYDFDEKKMNFSVEIVLDLNEDHTYSYLLRDLRFVAADTGTFSVKDDTIYFKSKYPEGPMHARYFLSVNNEVIYKDILEYRVNEVDTTQWFYIRIVADQAVSLPSGFRLEANNFDFIYKGDFKEHRYEMYLPKRQINLDDLIDFEIYFPDLNLIMNVYGDKKYLKFKHAMIIVLVPQMDDQKIPDDWFITPKTLYKQKAVMKDNNLLFIKRNGVVNDDIVLKLKTL